MRNSKIQVTGKYIYYGSWFFFFFFGSKENLFHVKNILYDWYYQIIESLWEKKQ